MNGQQLPEEEEEERSGSLSERGAAVVGESAARRTFLGEKTREAPKTRMPPAPLGGAEALGAAAG